MKTVIEVSRLTGVSVRTLHHYDAIGLLAPTKVTEAGYRLYDDEALARLQTILLYRELEFSLKDIREILDSPGFDRREALRQQITLLQMQRQHIDELLALARKLEKTGGTAMSFDAFDTKKLESYKKEAKERWGDTSAYREYEARPKTDAAAGKQMMDIFAEFGTLRHLDPAGEAPKAKAKELQQFITDHYYTCTPEILAGLGQMYVADERFRENIDHAGGEGTAEFAAKAIAAYCAK